MNGFAVIILGFVAYGVLHINTPRIMPWQWYTPLTPRILRNSHSSS